MFDGEVVAWDDSGRPDFDRLAPRLRRSREPKPRVVYHVFDLLAVGEVDLRVVPLVERKRLLERALPVASTIVRAMPYVVGDGRAIAAFVAEHDLEGFVAKRAASPYTPGPSSSWVKRKRRSEAEFLVTAFRTDRQGRIDALKLAGSGRELAPPGIVELGVWRVAPALGRTSSDARPGWSRAPSTLVVTVTFTGRTSGGRLREAVVKGVRLHT